jgi:hypothetical protein
MKGGDKLGNYIPEVMRVMQLKYPNKFKYSYKDARDPKTGDILSEEEVKNRQAKRLKELMKKDEGKK